MSPIPLPPEYGAHTRSAPVACRVSPHEILFIDRLGKGELWWVGTERMPNWHPARWSDCGNAELPEKMAEYREAGS